MKTTLNETVAESYGISKAHGFHDAPEALQELDRVIAGVEEVIAQNPESSELMDAILRDLRTTRVALVKQSIVDTFNTKLVLIHSEISEALEEYRAGKPSLYFNDAKPDKPEGWGIELIDAFIRIADLLGLTGQDFEYLYQLKRDYNKTRSYKHGKAY